MYDKMVMVQNSVSDYFFPVFFSSLLHLRLSARFLHSATANKSIIFGKTLVITQENDTDPFMVFVVYRCKTK